jgi:predicted ABC-type ATPase
VSEQRIAQIRVETDLETIRDVFAWSQPPVSELAPNVVILAGPNGAGKSTAASLILQDILGIDEFVNADVIAQGLSGFEPERASPAAGRIMLARIRELARQRRGFAFETTLASRSFAPWITNLIRTGYQFQLVFLWLPNPDMAVERVAARVRQGGHHAREATIRRRYEAGLSIFFRLHQPMMTSWRLCDNSGAIAPKVIASGKAGFTPVVAGLATWEQIQARYGP